MDTSHLWQALTDTIQLKDTSLGPITLQQRKLGELVLSTGQVVACDPLVFPETKSFQTTVSPGRYPLFASVAWFARDNDQCMAYALLQLHVGQPVRWKLATLAGQDNRSLEEDQFFGYPVDSGTACLMDIDAAAGLQRRFDADRGSVDRLIEDLLAHETMNITLNPWTGANAIVFHAGWGDGVYASYWGYDAEDNLLCLVTDFALLSHPALPHLQRSLKRNRGFFSKWFRREGASPSDTFT